MRAVGYKKSLPITDTESLLDVEIADPVAGGRDLLVEIRAVSVNPVDTKIRRRSEPEPGTEYKVLGYDAAGVVKAAGPDVTLFKPGDEVFYAGSIARQGTNSELHLVDERIVGHKPKSLGFAHAAALPLTSLTAWELLFDRFGVREGEESKGNLLIVGGAGGVGSILIQLARKLTGLTVIATASRPETKAWCEELGAHHVIDHSQPMMEQLRAIGISAVELIASLTATDTHYPALVEMIAPQGKLGVIDGPASLDALPLKLKCASLHWEYMFARSFYETADMIEQHRILDRIAKLVDAGVVRTTFDHDRGTINATNMKTAHELVESGRAKGKVVLAGF